VYCACVRFDNLKKKLSNRVAGDLCVVVVCGLGGCENKKVEGQPKENME